MIRTLAWKQYREQRAAWLLMAGLAVVTVLGGLWGILHLRLHAASWFVLGLPALLIAAAYGVVCAALLVAGDLEAGTLAFLEALGRRRSDLWRTKFWTGIGLTAALASLIAIGLAALGVANIWNPLDVLRPWYRPGSALMDRWLNGVLLPLVFTTVALEAFAWAMLLSALCRNVLTAIALSTLPTLAVWTAVLLTAHSIQSGILAGIGIQLAPAGLALVTSWWLFTRQDAERAATGVAVPAWMAVLWLTVRQGWQTMLALLGAAAVLGIVAAWPGWLVAPLGTLTLGVLCGVAVFGGEQSGGWRRFLGDQRLPAGRIWAIKTGVWLLVAVAAMLVLLVAGAITLRLRLPSPADGSAYYEAMRREAFQPILRFWHAAGWNFWTDHPFGGTLEFLGEPRTFAVWLTYGFSVGLLCTLAVRKTAVALVIALALSFLLAVLWVPSLVGGGVHAWQLFGLPAILLLFSRRAMWAWAGEQLDGRKQAWGVLACGLSVAGWMGGNFWYRVAEIPSAGPPFDLQAYLAGIPAGAENEAGRLLRSAIEEVHESQLAARRKVGPLTDPPFADGPREYVSADHQLIPTGGYRYEDQANLALLHGWPANNRLLNRWLDLVCQGPWLDRVRRAASLRLGVVDGPREIAGRVDWWRGPHAEQQVADMLCARALQLHARREDALALDHLVWALAYSRNLRHDAVGYAGATAESSVLVTLVRWSSDPGPTPVLLRRALEELRRHEQAVPPEDERIRADYALGWLSLTHPDASRWPADWDHPLGQELAVAAMQVPWEAARCRRLFNYLYQKRMHAENLSRHDIELYQATSLLWMFGAHLPPGPDTHAELARRRLTELKLALVLYQAEHDSRPAATLAELVPRYLPAIPIDPVSEVPFGYQVSSGGWVMHREPLVGVGFFQYRQELVQVPKGQGLITRMDRAEVKLPSGGSKTVLSPDEAVERVPRWSR